MSKRKGPLRTYRAERRNKLRENGGLSRKLSAPEIQKLREQRKPAYPIYYIQRREAPRRRAQREALKAKVALSV